VIRRPSTTNAPSATGDLAVVAPVDGVVLEEVREIVGIGEVIDRHEVETLAIEQDSQGGPGRFSRDR
jgi:hypothetical protein